MLRHPSIRPLATLMKSVSHAGLAAYESHCTHLLTYSASSEIALIRAVTTVYHQQESFSSTRL